ncbi:hypothetical protein CFC21_062983 [Triticum aestivum]|uniref:VQ domain-containing protein n=2 Tax=Triticum aestivum TaxID=4565 RepID=A0A3B6JLV2_WHEAT|nr:hypothetical protein CFC21_062983 [Triticum aestivum]
MAMGNNGVKVTYIETQFVTSDAASFKSLVQRLTGKSGAEAAAAPLPRCRSREDERCYWSAELFHVHHRGLGQCSCGPRAGSGVRCQPRRLLGAGGTLGLLGAVLRSRTVPWRQLQ